MYSEEICTPMREDLTKVGFIEMKTPEEVEASLRSLLVEVRQAQAVYQQDMSTLYARSGYKLVTDEVPQTGAGG